MLSWLTKCQLSTFSSSYTLVLDISPRTIRPKSVFSESGFIAVEMLLRTQLSKELVEVWNGLTIELAVLLLNEVEWEIFVTAFVVFFVAWSLFTPDFLSYLNDGIIDVVGNSDAIWFRIPNRELCQKQWFDIMYLGCYVVQFATLWQQLCVSLYPLNMI